MQIKKDFFVKNRMYSIILSDMSMWNLAHRHAFCYKSAKKLAYIPKKLYLCARIIVLKRNEIDRHRKHVLAFAAEIICPGW